MDDLQTIILFCMYEIMFVELITESYCNIYHRIVYRRRSSLMLRVMDMYDIPSNDQCYNNIRTVKINFK